MDAATPMPIERNRDWGSEQDRSSHALRCHDDAAVAAAVQTGAPLIQIAGGDLARTLGLPSVAATSATAWHVPVDVLRVSLDGKPSMVAAAHVVVGSWFSQLGYSAVLNAAFIGTQNLAPRAHPGDGYADHFTSTVTGSDRFKAQRRAGQGTHVPHPQISIRRVQQHTLQFSKARRVRVDGVAAGRATTLDIEVVPNAIVVEI